MSKPYGGRSRESTIDEIERGSLMDKAELLLTTSKKSNRDGGMTERTNGEKIADRIEPNVS